MGSRVAPDHRKRALARFAIAPWPGSQSRPGPVRNRALARFAIAPWPGSPSGTAVPSGAPRPGTGGLGGCRRGAEGLGRWWPVRSLRGGLTAGRRWRPGKVSDLRGRLELERPICWRLGRFWRWSWRLGSRRGLGRWGSRGFGYGRRLRRCRSRLHRKPGAGQCHDQIVKLVLEPVEPLLEPVDLVFESVEPRLKPVEASIDLSKPRVARRGLLVEPALDMVAQVTKVRTHPAEARAARRYENCKCNPQERGEDFNFHRNECITPL